MVSPQKHALVMQTGTGVNILKWHSYGNAFSQIPMMQRSLFPGRSIHVLVHSLNKHFLRAHFRPGTVLATGSMTVSKADTVPEQKGVYILHVDVKKGTERTLPPTILGEISQLPEPSSLFKETVGLF